MGQDEGSLIADCGESKKAKANAEHLVKCWNSHAALRTACEVAVLALTHKPINPDDVAFVKAAIAKATD